MLAQVLVCVQDAAMVCPKDTEATKEVVITPPKRVTMMA